MKHATEYLTFETPHRRDYVNITDRVDTARHLVFGTTKSLSGVFAVVDDPRNVPMGTDGIFDYVGFDGVTGSWQIYPLHLDADLFIAEVLRDRPATDRDE